MKLESYMGNLVYYSTTDLITRFADYDNGYISDIVSEIADFAISIYTQDLYRFAINHEDDVDEAIAEGFCGNPGDYSSFREYLVAVGSAAWYYHNERDIYDNIRQCLIYGVCEALGRQYGITEITDEQINILEHIDFEINDCYEDCIERAAEELGLITEEEDEENDID